MRAMSGTLVSSQDSFGKVNYCLTNNAKNFMTSKKKSVLEWQEEGY
jgi:hypothetical protein